MHKHFRTVLATAAAAALTGGLLAATAGTAAAEGARPTADFNGDGYLDVAVSAPGAYVNGRAHAGQVVVLYGTANGISGAKRTVLSQDSAGVPGVSEKGDRWGADTTAADFNNDGYTDLAVSAPYEKVGDDVNGGTVQIVWGSASGLSGGTTVKDPASTSHDRFGYTLEGADFDGDDKADLAIGSSSATIRVYRGGFGKTSGTTGGVYSVRPAMLSGSDTGPLNLHSGDVNGDDIADLVADGFENEASDGENHWNANYYLPGSGSGLTITGSSKLAAGVITDIGDTNSDGYGDIVIGMFWDADSGVPGASKGGKVNIVHGSANGPDSGRTAITQDSPGVPGGSESYDAFGAELDLGDVNGDGHLDLVVGSPGESLDGFAATGAATVLYGAADGSGITGAGAQMFHQNTAGVPNSNEEGDNFGSDVHLADLNGDGKADLTVGAMGENGGNGAVYALKSNGSVIGGSGVSIYTSTVGVSASGSPVLGVNFAG
ncbi:FG-GAP-like repeat-containing protein [Streptomyces sp. WAC 00631]|uniref:FG-GAP-like repeat-containing protein n=1 Tax=unclassified Streptomyces TaxID=2593676 RepID=UPI000F7B0E9F|nr:MULTISPECIES: FG-GAP-like repeat-containing protein [unclassified Streptomyces]MCC5032492.1 FG-GAP-like repeat-containing protein [Streptomyces sp. WAC 00631]MCC9740596.1 FG-GAP-like repeat-containing protein [Streptomyces sp. MNU89]